MCTNFSLPLGISELLSMEQHTLKSKTIVRILTFTLALVVKVLIYIQMLFILSSPLLIRHLWQLKKVIFLHLCLIRAVQFFH